MPPTAAAGTWYKPSAVLKTITPSGFHVPPKPKTTSQMVWRGPPATLSLLSLPSAKNAMTRLSGDQKGKRPRSVPGMICDSSPSVGRMARIRSPSRST